MEPHSSFDIPLEALSDGTHRFTFHLDTPFFVAHEGALLDGGDVGAHLEVDKVRGHYTLHFGGAGGVDVECDRCLQPVRIPIDFDEEVVLKFGGTAIREEAEVIYLPVGTDELNVARVLYELVTLSVPIAHTHDDAGETCDPEMTKFLASEEAATATPEDDSAGREISEDSPWAALRGFEPSDN